MSHLRKRNRLETNMTTTRQTGKYKSVVPPESRQRGSGLAMNGSNGVTAREATTTTGIAIIPGTTDATTTAETAVIGINGPARDVEATGAGTRATATGGSRMDRQPL